MVLVVSFEEVFDYGTRLDTIGLGDFVSVSACLRTSQTLMFVFGSSTTGANPLGFSLVMNGAFLSSGVA